MIPVIVINNESAINGLPDIGFVNTYQCRRNNIPPGYVFGCWRKYNYISHDDIGLFAWNYLDTILSKDIAFGNEYMFINKFTKHYSTSIGPACVCSSIRDGKYVPESSLLERDDLLWLANNRINILKRTYPNVELSFENTAYRDTIAYEYITDADFITELVINNDVGFTLDIAHALITTRQKNMGINVYLDSLPLERCREVHLSSPDWIEDKHELPDDYIMTLFGCISSRIKQDAYIVVEYYRDMNKLKDFYESVLMGCL